MGDHYWGVAQHLLCSYMTMQEPAMQAAVTKDIVVNQVITYLCNLICTNELKVKNTSESCLFLLFT